MDEVIMVLTTLPQESDAQAMARLLVEGKLVACASILPAVQSVYRWQGQLETATESVLMMKTTAQRYPEVEAAILAAHPYALPEIMALPVVEGLPAYLSWVRQETRKEIDV